MISTILDLPLPSCSYVKSEPEGIRVIKIHSANELTFTDILNSGEVFQYLTRGNEYGLLNYELIGSSGPLDPNKVTRAKAVLAGKPVSAAVWTRAETTIGQSQANIVFTGENGLMPLAITMTRSLDGKTMKIDVWSIDNSSISKSIEVDAYEIKSRNSAYDVNKTDEAGRTILPEALTEYLWALVISR